MITRLIDKNIYNKILSEYQAVHKDEIENFHQILDDLDDNLIIGKKLINMRNEFYCKEYYFQFKTNDIIISKYDTNQYLKDQFNGCKKLVQPKLNDMIFKLEKKYNEINIYENKIIDKCFVLEFSSDSINNCLNIKMNKFQNKIAKEIKDYYQELNLFKNNPYC